VDNRIVTLLILYLVCLSFAPRLYSEELLIVRGDGQYAPFEFTQNNKLVGLHIDMINNVATQANIKVSFKSYPWKRAMSMVENGEADAITYLGRRPEREKYTYYFKGNVLSYTRNHFVISRSRDIEYNGDLRDLSGYRIGIVRGFMYGDEFSEADYIKKYRVNKREQMLAMLSKGRLDVALLNPLKLRTRFVEHENFSSIKVLEPPLTELPNYLGFSKPRKRRDIGEAFSKYMAEFKRSTHYTALLKKYGVSR